MNTYLDESIEAIVKFIQLTQERKLEWKIEVPNKNGVKSENDVVFFKADYKGKTLRLHYLDINGRPEKKGSLADFDFNDLDEKRICFEIIDSRSDTMWSFPRISLLVDLFVTVQWQLSGAEEYIKSVLKP